MKNWLYIPFLLLMSVTYTRVVDNYNSEQTFNSGGRKPASFEEKIQEDCLDLPSKFNPHFITGKCELQI